MKNKYIIINKGTIGNVTIYERKIIKRREEVKMSVHHILPKSKGGSNYFNNLVNLEEKEHRKRHEVFENLTPEEQLIRVLEFNEKAIKKEVIEKIIAILDDYNGDIYKNGVKKK